MLTATARMQLHQEPLHKVDRRALAVVNSMQSQTKLVRAHARRATSAGLRACLHLGPSGGQSVQNRQQGQEHALLTHGALRVRPHAVEGRVQQRGMGQRHHDGVEAGQGLVGQLHEPLWAACQLVAAFGELKKTGPNVMVSPFGKGDAGAHGLYQKGVGDGPSGRDW